MRRLCPNGTFSCVRKFRRNVIGINATFQWLLMWCFASLICCLSVDYGRNILSVQAQFWIWNTSEFVCYEGLHFVLPFLLSLPSQGREHSAKIEFYVGKPSFEPVRLKIIKDFHSTSIGKGKGKGKGEGKNKSKPSESMVGEEHIIHVSEYQCITGRSVSGNKLCQPKMKGLDPPSSHCQPMSVFPQSPLPPLSAMSGFAQPPLPLPR